MSRPGRRYRMDEKMAAVELSEQIGVAPAAERLGIPEPTVKTWRRRLRAEVAVAAELEEAALDELGDLSFAEQREVLSKRFARLALAAANRTEVLLARDDMKGAKDAAVVAGIAVDKLAVFAGIATRRVESVSLSIDTGAEYLHDPAVQEAIGRLQRRSELGSSAPPVLEVVDATEVDATVLEAVTP